MSFELDDSQYEQKYLKYKAKYLALKAEYEAQGGALFAKTGVAAIVSTSARIAKIENDFKAGKAPSRFSLDKANDCEAYIIYNGEDSMELMESTTRQLSDTASNVAAKTSQMASAAASKAKELGSAAYDASSKAAVKAKELGVAAYDASSKAASKASTSIVSLFKKTGGSATSAQLVKLPEKFDYTNRNHRLLVRKLAMAQGVNADSMIIVSFNRFGSNQMIKVYNLVLDSTKI
jgi:hypothetical protein